MSNITIRKGNVELTVPEDQKERYLNLGYDAYDEAGNLIAEAPTTDVQALQAKIVDLLKENSELKAELEKAKPKKSSPKKEA